MAGSYNHVVKKDGSLLKPERVCGMLDSYSGDVFEAVEEMYGMIWYLAEALSHCYPWNLEDGGVPHIVEEARQNYRRGLQMSPTKRYQED
jgi:hypothetical protein